MALGNIRRTLFYVFAGLLSAFLLLGFWAVPLELLAGWLPDAALTSIIPELARQLPHRLHNMAMDTLLLGLLLGVVLQLRHPERRIAPLLQALTFILAFAVIELALDQFTVMGTAPIFIPLVLVALLHPRARDLLRRPRMDRTMVGLTALAAVPWLVFALGQAQLARLNLPTDEHAQLEHWTRMVVFPTLVIGWGLIGSSDHSGWRLTAWNVTLASIVFGLQSLLFPGQASALPAGWAIAAVAWGGIYLRVAERRARSAQPGIAEGGRG